MHCRERKARATKGRNIVMCVQPWSRENGTSASIIASAISKSEAFAFDGNELASCFHGCMLHTGGMSEGPRSRCVKVERSDAGDEPNMKMCSALFVST